MKNDLTIIEYKDISLTIKEIWKVLLLFLLFLLLLIVLQKDSMRRKITYLNLSLTIRKQIMTNNSKICLIKEIENLP